MTRRFLAYGPEVVPKEIIHSSALYDASIPTRFGDVPNRQMGFDIVAVESGDGRQYLVTRTTPRCPSASSRWP